MQDARPFETLAKPSESIGAIEKMSFEYCCFISYPHGQDNVLIPFVKNFVEGLELEIKASTRKKVWTDYKFLQGGNKLDQKVGAELCKSACMIIIYTPLYFDTEHVYCARELKAMQELEEQRLKLLSDQGNGLIIPIILRGEKKFPKSISKQEIYYKFTDIEFNKPEHVIREKYSSEIKKIAEYILDRCDDLDEVSHHISHDCNQYMLPSEDDARDFVEQVLGKKIKDVAVPFAGRMEVKSE